MSQRIERSAEIWARLNLSLGTLVLASFLGLALALAGVIGAPQAHANYADGRRAFDDGDFSRAVSLWRRSAWQEDDLYSQVELGKLYSVGRNTGRDDIEAYVWFYLASVNTNSLGISPTAKDETDKLRAYALIERAKLYGPMVPSLRAEAHNRIVYILASRGANGFFRLGEIYDEGFGEYSTIASSSFASGGAAAATQFPGLFSDSGAPSSSSSSAASVEAPSLSQDERERYAIYSGISRNNAEALAYYLKAGGRGHPLAGLMAEKLKASLASTNAGFGKLVLEAAQKREITWTPPFERYPSHSDESVGDADREVALIKAEEELEVRFVQHALRALALYNLSIDNQKGPGTRRAIAAFQEQNGYRKTGELTGEQTVALIQKAALRGHAISQNTLGTMYYKGIGTPVDYNRARFWFQRAADQRYPYALYNLCVMYRDGLGVPVDTSIAANYCLAARGAGYGPGITRELRQLGWE